LLSRVAELSDDTVVIQHPAAHSGFGDSDIFGPLPRANVRSTVVVVFAPDDN